MQAFWFLPDTVDSARTHTLLTFTAPCTSASQTRVYRQLPSLAATPLVSPKSVKQILTDQLSFKQFLCFVGTESARKGVIVVGHESGE